MADAVDSSYRFRFRRFGWLVLQGALAAEVSLFAGLVAQLQSGGITTSDDGGKTWRPLTMDDQIASFSQGGFGHLPFILVGAMLAAVAADIVSHWFVKDRSEAWGVCLALAMGWMPGLLLAMMTWGFVGPSTFWATSVVAMLVRVAPSRWARLADPIIAVLLGCLAAGMLWGF